MSNTREELVNMEASLNVIETEVSKIFDILPYSEKHIRRRLTSIQESTRLIRRDLVSILPTREYER